MTRTPASATHEHLVRRQTIRVAIAAAAIVAIAYLAIGAGVSNVLAGARLRYEIARSFAPYVGVEWSGAVGDTRDLIRANGDDADATRIVLGVRALF